MAGLAEQIAGRIEIRANDRVLHLGFGDGEVTRRIARRVPEGLVLGVDPSDDRVRRARRLSVDFDNVMFVLGSPEEIPWQEHFFSVALMTAEWARPGRAAGEIFRVLAPGGRIYLTGATETWESALAEAGFEQVTRGELLTAAKPAAPARPPDTSPFPVIK